MAKTTPRRRSAGRKYGTTASRTRKTTARKTTPRKAGAAKRTAAARTTKPASCKGTCRSNAKTGVKSYAKRTVRSR